MNFSEYLEEKLVRKKVVRNGQRVIKKTTDIKGFKVVKDKDTGLSKQVREPQAEVINRKKGQIKAKAKKKSKEKAAIQKKKRSERLRIK